MPDVDWNTIAHTIRERRFNDIPDYIWEHVADKIETKKRGRGRPPKGTPGKEKMLISELFRQMKPLVGEKTYSERCLWIENRYNQLREEGKKCGAAQELIASELCCSKKVIEQALTATRAHNEVIKAFNKAPTILSGFMMALDMSFDENGDLITSSNVPK